MISIITITFNNFEQLKQTLDSIPKLDFIESVVINGGDCPKTKKFLEDYPCKSISEKDEGISDAFNKGIKLSSGDYIMFLNSGDVLISPDYLFKAKSILDNNKDIVFVHSNIIFSDQLGAELFMKPLMKNLGRGMPYLHQTMIVRRKVFDEVGLFKKELKYAMDFDLVVRMEKKNYKGFYLNEGAVVKMDGSGVSIVKEKDSILECFKVLKDEKYLTFRNLVGFIIRFLKFLGRKTILSIKGDRILKFIKLSKYKP
ncbi:MAG: glycosyltransferase [Ignavibacterium sp.]|nr:glycosyltransferase [Ignavibacterium sp.]